MDKNAALKTLITVVSFSASIALLIWIGQQSWWRYFYISIGILIGFIFVSGIILMIYCGYEDQNRDKEERDRKQKEFDERIRYTEDD